MGDSELQVVAGLWRGMAVLVMDGVATDRAGRHVEDALFQVALASGLRLTTDLDHLDPRPVRGWRLVVDRFGTVTLSWPHRSPLLAAAPLDLPPGWRDAVARQEAAVVFAGHGLGMRTPGTHPLRHLRDAATRGTVAAAPIPARVSPVQATMSPVQATEPPVLARRSPSRTSNSRVRSDGLAGRERWTREVGDATCGYDAETGS